MDYYGQFPRRPTMLDHDDIDQQYQDYFDGFSGRTLAIKGSEALIPEMNLVVGESFTRVGYDKATDRFYLIHDNVLDRRIEFDADGDPIELEADEYDALDAACDRYHYRKELQD